MNSPFHLVIILLYNLNLGLGQEKNVILEKNFMNTSYYSIGEVSKLLNIPISTIRYYDKHELLPFVQRTESGLRQFSDLDIDILTYIICFKTAGMPIKEIKCYFKLYEMGDSTIAERYELIRNQQLKVEQQIEDLQKALMVLADKAKDYKSQLTE